MVSNVSEQLWQDFKAVKQNAFNAIVNIFKENNITNINIYTIQRKLSEMANKSDKKLSCYYEWLIEDIRAMQGNYSFDVCYGGTFRESIILGVEYDPTQSEKYQLTFKTESIDGELVDEVCAEPTNYYLCALSVLEDVLSVVGVKDGVITPKAPYYYVVYENAEVISESNLFETKDEAFQYAIDDACNYVKKMALKSDGNCTLHIKKEQGLLLIGNSKNESLRMYCVKQYTPDKD